MYLLLEPCLIVSRDRFEIEDKFMLRFENVISSLSVLLTCCKRLLDVLSNLVIKAEFDPSINLDTLSTVKYIFDPSCNIDVDLLAKDMFCSRLPSPMKVVADNVP
jgi:hypothetical protein